MNRITRRNEDGIAYYLRCFESPCNGNGCKIPKCSLDDKICERLAAYEDAGLEPEEVKELEIENRGLKANKVIMEKIIEGKHNLHDTALINQQILQIAQLRAELEVLNTPRLRELVQAEKAGRLVVLPCKVGDTVYVIPSKANYALNILSRHPENNRVYEQTVREIRTYNGSVFLLVTCDGTQSVHSKFFGETWFLTREEADAALEAQKGKHHEADPV